MLRLMARAAAILRYAHPLILLLFATMSHIINRLLMTFAAPRDTYRFYVRYADFSSPICAMIFDASLFYYDSHQY